MPLGFSLRLAEDLNRTVTPSLRIYGHAATGTVVVTALVPLLPVSRCPAHTSMVLRLAAGSSWEPDTPGLLKTNKHDHSLQSIDLDTEN